MDPTFTAVLALVPAPYGQYVATALTILSAICFVCSVIDASFPQPAEGSRWVPIRHVIALGALSLGAARNLVRPGAVPASVQQTVDAVQEAAAKTAQEAGKLVTQAEAGVPVHAVGDKA